MTVHRGKFGRTAERLARPAMFFIRGVVDFVYPPQCLLCEERLETGFRFVCRFCRDQLALIERPVVDGWEYVHRLGGDVYFSHSTAFFRYTPDLQKLIHAFKYQNMSGLVDFFAGEMSSTIAEMPQCCDADYFVAVPLHGTRKRERGYNQSGLLAQRLSLMTGIPILNDCLVRIRHTTQQAKLDGHRRAQNVRNAFVVKRPDLVHGRKLLVVDDVLTTGNTVNECAKVFKGAGARQVIAMTIVRI